MNAGLSNLQTLKAWLLADTLRASTEYDTAITAIGLGVAGACEKFCARKFLRVVDDTVEFTAEREHIVLPRFPLETITAVEFKLGLSPTWTAQTVADVVMQRRDAAGLVHLASALGTYFDTVRITYTGGYWWDLSETTTPDAQPSGSAALPGDLRLAWLLQCEHVWKQKDKLGVAIAEKPAATSSLSTVELLPAVKEQLRAFANLALS